MPQKRQSRQKTEQWREVKKTLKAQFNHTQLREGQEEVIRSVLAGKNVLAIMPTGAGKSLCYQLPALHLKGATIVVSPLISLMKDQRESVEEKGISAVELNSNVKASVVSEGLRRIKNDDTEILYVTPERFTSDDFISSIGKAKIDFVVIDEAHCVSQWGHDFRPAYLSISDTLKKLKNPPVLALTATATDEVASDIQKQLGLKEMELFRTSVLRENLQFEARYTNTPQEKLQALLQLLPEMQDSSGIIYTATVKSAKEIHEFLAENGVESILYHGKLRPKEREENQNEFMNFTPRIMVATNAFGMGIDKPDIRFVVHFQFPGSLEAYYQEAGRAGRDGEPARCILLYLRRDKSTQSLFLSGKYPTSEEVSAVYQRLQKHSKKGLPILKKNFEEELSDLIPKKKVAVIMSLLKQLKVFKVNTQKEVVLTKANLSAEQIASLAVVYQERAERDRKKLNKVITYAQSALCRWKNILEYFNESAESDSCGHCDNCLKENPVDISAVAQVSAPA